MGLLSQAIYGFSFNLLVYRLNLLGCDIDQNYATRINAGVTMRPWIYVKALKSDTM